MQLFYQILSRSPRRSWNFTCSFSNMSNCLVGWTIIAIQSNSDWFFEPGSRSNLLWNPDINSSNLKAFAKFPHCHQSKSFYTTRLGLWIRKYRGVRIGFFAILPSAREKPAFGITLRQNHTSFLGSAIFIRFLPSSTQPERWNLYSPILLDS